MLEGVWYGVAAALVFLGLIYTVYIITVKIFSADCCDRTVVVLSSESGGCDIGSVLYSAHMRLAFSGRRTGRILIVNNGLNENQLDLCIKIMNECGSMDLCRPDELAAVLTGKDK